MRTTDSSQKIYAQQIVELFRGQYQPELVLFACHAALPVVLNAEFLHLIRINFFLDALPYTAEAKLLHSPICEGRGNDLYEIQSDVRNILLQKLREKYGDERLHQVAGLLWHYIDQRSPWEDYPRLKRARQLTALNFLNPEKAQEWLAEAEESFAYQESGMQDWFVAMYREIGRREVFDKIWKKKQFYELRYKIVDFLSSIPNIHEKSWRIALVTAGDLDKELLYSIDFEGSPNRFVQLLVSTLWNYGRLKDDRHALEAILEASKNYVGHDKRTYCDNLIQQIRTFLLESDHIENIEEDNQIPGKEPVNKRLPSILNDKIVESLERLPNMQLEKDRVAFLYAAFLDKSLVASINCKGSTRHFTTSLVSQLFNYGKLQDERYALVAILQAAKEHVGRERQKEYDHLIREFYSFLQTPDIFEDEVSEEADKQQIIDKRQRKDLSLGLQNRIIEFFQSTPSFQTEQDRLALVYGGVSEPELLHTIDFTLPSNQLYQSLVVHLLDYGQLQDGIHALEAVLESSLHLIKYDGDRAYCNFLLQELHPLLEETNISKNQKLVLIVDDEPRDRKRLTQILQKLGYKVIEAGTNVHALELLDEHNLTCSLVTTDALRYPEYSGEDGYVGLELIKIINRKFPELPIVLVAFDSPELLRKEASDLRVDGVLSKDLSDEDMSVAFQKVLSKYE